MSGIEWTFIDIGMGDRVHIGTHVGVMTGDKWMVTICESPKDGRSLRNPMVIRRSGVMVFNRTMPREVPIGQLMTHAASLIHQFEILNGLAGS